MRDIGLCRAILSLTAPWRVVGVLLCEGAAGDRSAGAGGSPVPLPGV